MLIKPNQSISPIDRKTSKTQVRKTEHKEDVHEFDTLLEEIDVIHISSQDENSKEKPQEKSQKDKDSKPNAENKIKLDKFA